jgi:hypothetical protein
MTKIIKLTEKDLSKLVNKVLSEQEVETENYMFFSNLKQIARQCKMLLEMDHQMIDEILKDGHDWADDHVSEAKTNMDQVFDFIMNEKTKMDQYVDYEDVNEQDYSTDIDRPTSDRERQVKGLFGSKYGSYIPNDVIRYIRKNPAQFIKRIYQMYGDKIYDYLDKVKKDSEENVNIFSEGKKKTGTKLCARGKSAAKAKFKVYPSAYSSGYGVQVCKGRMPGLDGKKRCSPPYC